MTARFGGRLLLSCLLAFVAVLRIFSAQQPALAAMHMARSGHQATLLLDGRVLVAGGADEKGRAIGPAEIFDPATRIWSVAATNIVPRLGHGAALLADGRVLVVGGVPVASSCESIGSAEVYDPTTDRWSMTPDLPVRVGLGTAAVSLEDGRVLVIGGGTSCGTTFDSAALFDPAANTWTATTSMRTPAQFHVATLLADGRVAVSGGTAEPPAPGSLVAVYEPETGTWGALSEPRPLTGTACDGYLRTYSSVLPRDAVIARATPENCPSLTVLPARTLFAAGGLSEFNVVKKGVELSALETGDEFRSWPMQVARIGHTATRLKNGLVLIAGGCDGTSRLASSEIYIPRLPYDQSMVAVVRGWSDRTHSHDYGKWLAAARNSRNHLLISYGGGTPVPTRLLEWDPREWTDHRHAGDPSHRRDHHDVFAREVGTDLPELNSIRLDDRENIWGVSAAAKEVIKISSQGNVLQRFGAPGDVPRRQDVEIPTDVAIDRRGNVFVTDAGKRPRIIKYDPRGRFLGAIGGRGSEPRRLDLPNSVATDGSGNVYVADSGNARIQVFDNNLNLRAVYENVGTPWAVCVSKGRDQFLYSASNPDKGETITRSAEIYKLELDGTILGKTIADDFDEQVLTPRHIHCLDAKTIFSVGYQRMNLITFGR